MNRRGFFKSLALLTGAASLSPHIFIPKFEPVKWKPPIIFKRAGFQQFFIEMTPIFDEAILAELAKTDGGLWIWNSQIT